MRFPEATTAQAQLENTMSNEPEDTEARELEEQRNPLATSVAVGIALGTAFGAAFDQLGLGVALGVAIGIAVGKSREAKLK